MTDDEMRRLAEMIGDAVARKIQQGNVHTYPTPQPWWPHHEPWYPPYQVWCTANGTVTTNNDRVSVGPHV